MYRHFNIYHMNTTVQATFVTMGHGHAMPILFITHQMYVIMSTGNVYISLFGGNETF